MTEEVRETLFLLILQSPEGDSYHLLRTEQGLTNCIYKYVKENWLDNMPQDSDIPEDKRLAIAQYWDRVDGFYTYTEELEVEDE